MDDALSKLETLAQESIADYEAFLELAESEAWNGIYEKDSSAYNNLIEAHISLGIATGLRFAATVPTQELNDVQL